VRYWDAHFMQMAKLAGEMSTCARRDVGCVLVKDRHLLATGFNGNMPGARHCADGGCPRCSNSDTGAGADLSICLCTHAEANAIAWCARTGAACQDATLYSTTQPCLECTKLLASAGVSLVIYRDDYPGAITVPRGARITVTKMAERNSIHG
jgi:dCMP deaminase